MTFQVKHEELYSAPLCKLYAFEAKRALCAISNGSTGNSGEPGGDLGDPVVGGDFE